jgi:hypothetical protein
MADVYETFLTFLTCLRLNRVRDPRIGRATNAAGSVTVAYAYCHSFSM